jgi:hypothetical protein
MSWNLWVKVSDGEIIDKTTSGEMPKDFTVNVSGHEDGRNDSINVGVNLIKPQEVDSTE